QSLRSWCRPIARPLERESGLDSAVAPWLPLESHGTGFEPVGAALVPALSAVVPRVLRGRDGAEGRDDGQAARSAHWRTATGRYRSRAGDPRAASAASACRAAVPWPLDG